MSSSAIMVWRRPEPIFRFEPEEEDDDDDYVVFGPPITLEELREKACGCATCAMILWLVGGPSEFEEVH